MRRTSPYTSTTTPRRTSAPTWTAAARSPPPTTSSIRTSTRGGRHRAGALIDSGNLPSATGAGFLRDAPVRPLESRPGAGPQPLQSCQVEADGGLVVEVVADPVDL